MFIGHHWAAAIIGTVATVGWTIQGLGNAFYYRQVSSFIWLVLDQSASTHACFPDISAPQRRGPHYGEGQLSPLSLIRSHLLTCLFNLGQIGVGHTWGKSILHTRMKSCGYVMIMSEVCYSNCASCTFFVLVYYGPSTIRFFSVPKNYELATFVYLILPSS